VSTVHVYEAAAPVFPATSVAFTWNVCEPSATPVYAFGELQALKAPSNAHWNVAPASEEKEKLGLALLLGFVGDAVIEAAGATVSINHVQVAGVGSAFPAASTAYTAKMCVPSARPL
jgi:hypothetical protein